MALDTMYPGREGTPYTTLSQAINDTETRIYLAGLTDDGRHTVFPAAPNQASIFVPNTGTAEVVRYLLAGMDGDRAFIDVVRGVSGARQAWPAGARVGRYFTALDMETMQGNIRDIDRRTPAVSPTSTPTIAPADWQPYGDHVAATLSPPSGTKIATATPEVKLGYADLAALAEAGIGPIAVSWDDAAGVLRLETAEALEITLNPTVDWGSSYA